MPVLLFDGCTFSVFRLRIPSNTLSFLLRCADLGGIWWQFVVYIGVAFWLVEQYNYSKHVVVVGYQNMYRRKEWMVRFGGIDSLGLW